eukprot:9476390-Pyramimonas_sp.AAC.1
MCADAERQRRGACGAAPAVKTLAGSKGGAAALTHAPPDADAIMGWARGKGMTGVRLTCPPKAFYGMEGVHPKTNSPRQPTWPQTPRFKRAACPRTAIGASPRPFEIRGRLQR